MVWSPKAASVAYLDTLKLCKHEHERHHEPCTTTASLESSEFLSALAAGTSSRLIVEISPEASESTIALAAAARQTGGRLVCILPEEQRSLAESQQLVDESGLNDVVEFKVGDPHQLLHEYTNVDFWVVDCNKTDSYAGLLKTLDVNPRRSVVVANNLDGGKEGLARDLKCSKEKGAVRSVMHPIGNTMEVTMIGNGDEFGLERRVDRKGKSAAIAVAGRPQRHHHPRRSYWVKNVDEKSGEEHIYRVTKSI